MLMPEFLYLRTSIRRRLLATTAYPLSLTHAEAMAHLAELRESLATALPAQRRTGPVCPTC